MTLKEQFPAALPSPGTCPSLGPEGLRGGHFDLQTRGSVVSGTEAFQISQSYQEKTN